MASHKAAAFEIGCTNNEFLISTVCDRSLTSLRKCASTIVKNLKFSSLGADYKHLCKLIGISGDNAAFADAVNKLNSSVKHSIDIVFTGKVNLDKEKIENAVGTISNKVPELQNKTDAKSRSVESTQCAPPTHLEILVSGLDLTLVKGFVDAYVTHSYAHGNKIIVPDRFESILNRIKNPSLIERYASKLDKLSDIAGVLCFKAAANCQLAPSSINSSKEYTFASIKSIINKSL
jgi:hypothetical protein